MNPAQRQPPTREQVIEHLKGQIRIRTISLDLTERRRAVYLQRMKIAELAYAPFVSATRNERDLEHLRMKTALEEGLVECGFIDLQIAEMKAQLEQLENVLKQTESNILSPSHHGVMM